MAQGLSPLQQKIIVVLAGGLLLGAARSPTKMYRAFGEICDICNEIDRANVHRSLRSLLKGEFVTQTKNGDYGLTRKGRQRASYARLYQLSLPRPQQWDGKWRLVFSDIPEAKKSARDSVRSHLERLGCKKIQRSVWVYPHACFNELREVTQILKVEPYVHFALAEQISCERALRKHFLLPP